MAGDAAKEVGQQRKAAAYAEADQMDIAAGQEVAAASFNVERIARRAGEIMAANRTAAAKGGQSSTDASVLAVQAEIKSRSSVDQMLELVASQERARRMTNQAEQTRYQGRMDEYSGKMGQLQGYVGAASTVLEAVGADSYFSKGGGGGGGGGSSKAKAKKFGSP